MNGNNEFDVSYSRIVWIEGVLTGHPNVRNVTREHDIYFQIELRSGDEIRLVCLDEYACGVTRVREALAVFPDANVIFVGGQWNGYTNEAKEFCLEAKIGLYNASEINGALHRHDFWEYCRKDQDGNPTYPFNNS